MKKKKKNFNIERNKFKSFFFFFFKIFVIPQNIYNPSEGHLNT